MLDIPSLAKEVHGIDPFNIPPELLGGNEPLSLKDVARNWPLLQAGLTSHIENLYPGPSILIRPASKSASSILPNRILRRSRVSVRRWQQGRLPGDALYIPSMWWHHVEGMDTLNVLVNYWWCTVPPFMGPGIMAPIDDMQARQLRAWLINRLNR
jgi:hypothetical protein